MAVPGISQGWAGLHLLCPWQPRLGACPFLGNLIYQEQPPCYQPGSSLSVSTPTWQVRPVSADNLLGSSDQAVAGGVLSEAFQLITDLPQTSPPQQPWFVSLVSILPSMFVYERELNIKLNCVLNYFLKLLIY